MTKHFYLSILKNLLNTICGRYIICTVKLVSRNVLTTEMLTKICHSLLTGNLDKSVVTVKAKDSQLYLEHYLPVTVNVSGQHRVYTIYLCTKFWWAATRRLLALNCAVTLSLRSSTPVFFQIKTHRSLRVVLFTSDGVGETVLCC